MKFDSLLMIDTTAIWGLPHCYIENIVERTFTPSFGQLLIMPVTFLYCNMFHFKQMQYGNTIQ